MAPQPRCRAASTAVLETAPAKTQQFDLGGEHVTVASDVAPLFTPLKVGDMELSNRIVYAPLTRCRASSDNIINASAAEYYAQRSVPGTLLITEATNISQEGRGVPNTPGIWSQQQVDAWKPVVQAIKGKGAYVYCQLWHVGRASDPEYQPGNAAPISSSAVPITTPSWMVYTSKKGWAPYDSTPRAATKEDLQRIIQDYRRAARNAIEAGFDGVEVHGANGYLIDQFIKDSVNQRTDEYGGSIENRCRFALEVVAAVVDEIGASRTGMRITPFTVFNDAIDSTPYATHSYLCEKLNAFNLAYLHLVEPRVKGNVDEESPTDSLAPFRQAYKGVFIAAGGFTPKTGADAVASGHADLVAYGRTYLANPDFHKRLALGAPLNPYDRNTFYSQSTEGYLDYPTLAQQQQQQQ